MCAGDTNFSAVATPLFSGSLSHFYYSILIPIARDSLYNTLVHARHSVERSGLTEKKELPNASCCINAVCLTIPAEFISDMIYAFFYFVKRAPF